MEGNKRSPLLWKPNLVRVDDRLKTTAGNSSLPLSRSRPYSRLEMRFSNTKRLVACTVLMILVSDAIAQQQCCSNKIKESCALDIAAFGNDDNAKLAYLKTSGGSSDEIGTVEQRTKYRGVTVFGLDPTTCTTKSRQTFDTYGAWDDRVQLVEALESAKTDEIIVGITADTAEGEIGWNSTTQNSIGPFFTRYNMNLRGLLARDKFLFVMQKGYPKKTVFQRRPSFGDNLKMKIVLRGSTVQDVTFQQV